MLSGEQTYKLDLLGKARKMGLTIQQTVVWLEKLAESTWLATGALDMFSRAVRMTKKDANKKPRGKRKIQSLKEYADSEFLCRIKGESDEEFRKRLTGKKVP